MGQDQSRQSPALGKPSGYSTASVARGETLGDDKFLVVSAQTTLKEEDPELELLKNTPVFYPLLRSSLSTGLFGATDDSFDVLNPKPLIEICVRIQDHMSRCARQIHGDQEALHRSMKQFKAKSEAAENQACHHSAIRLTAANQAAEGLYRRQLFCIPLSFQPCCVSARHDDDS
eukprot:m.37889 g.37889  ORF g.37889 m.37889 type:complete len:174 (+) comp12553_c0_seq1:59-580(+)